jgi:hypothetical protein
MRSDGADDGEVPTVARREGIPLDAADRQPELADQLARDETQGRDVRVAASPGVYAADSAWVVPLDGVGAGWLAPASELSPIGSPITRQHPVELAVATARQMARVKGRVGLTMLDWRGSVPAALQVLSALVDNALKHGSTSQHVGTSLQVCLSITESQQLLVDVKDFDPAFADFRDVRAGVGDGLLAKFVRRGAVTDLTCFISPEAQSKTVRAVLTAGVVEP